MGDVMTSSDLGLKITQIRQQTGLSQERLAEMVGVTFQQIQKYVAVWSEEKETITVEVTYAGTHEKAPY